MDAELTNVLFEIVFKDTDLFTAGADRTCLEAAMDDLDAAGSRFRGVAFIDSTPARADFSEERRCFATRTGA